MIQDNYKIDITNFITNLLNNILELQCMHNIIVFNIVFHDHVTFNSIILC